MVTPGTVIDTGTTADGGTGKNVCPNVRKNRRCVLNIKNICIVTSLVKSVFLGD